MKRVILGTVVVGLVAAGAALADVPPPKGQKRVPVDYKIETEKEQPDWVFFTVIGGDKVTRVKLDPKNPVVIEGANRGGRYRLCSFVAVPKDAAEKYASEKELNEAVKDGKIAGLVRAKQGFDSFTVVKDSDTRKVIVEQFKLEKIDAKDGLVLKAVESEDKPKKEEEEESPSAYPAGVMSQWVAGGLAAAGVVGLAGFWAARRRRADG